MRRLAATVIVLAELAVLSRVAAQGDPAPVAAPPQRIEARRPTAFSAHCDHAPPVLFDQMVEAAAVESGIDPRLVAVTVYRESDCDPAALGSSGEVGLGQVHPKVWTASLVAAGIVRRAEDLWDPWTNLRATSHILAHLRMKADGQLLGMFRRYNGSGPRARAYAHEQVRAFSSLWGPT